MTEPDPTRVVADADVLAADLLVGGAARDALDIVRSHSWLEVVATPDLLAETETLIASLADEELSRAWRQRAEQLATTLDPDASGHPALVAAAAGKAATVLSFDQRLQSAAAGAAIRSRVATSVKSPDAFVRMTDPETLHEAIVGEPYSGADRDPRV